MQTVIFIGNHDVQGFFSEHGYKVVFKENETSIGKAIKYVDSGELENIIIRENCEKKVDDIAKLAKKYRDSKNFLAVVVNYAFEDFEKLEELKSQFGVICISKEY